MQLDEKLPGARSVLRCDANPHGTCYKVVPGTHATKPEEVLRELVLRDTSNARPLQCGLRHSKERNVGDGALRAHEA